MRLLNEQVIKGLYFVQRLRLKLCLVMVKTMVKKVSSTAAGVIILSIVTAHVRGK